MDDALVAAVLIGTPLTLAGVLGLSWLDGWRHRRGRAKRKSAKRHVAAPAFAPRTPYSPV